MGAKHPMPFRLPSGRYHARRSVAVCHTAEEHHLPPPSLSLLTLSLHQHHIHRICIYIYPPPQPHNNLATSSARKREREVQLRLRRSIRRARRRRMRRSSAGGADDLPLTPTGGWSWRNGYRRSSSPDGGEEQENRRPAVPSWPPRLRSFDGGIRSTYAPWSLFEDRVRTGPFGLSRFPSHPHSPVRILILETAGAGDGAVEPALWQFVRDYSPPPIRGDWILRRDQQEPVDPGLTEEEFGRAMRKLRRHVHNPPAPRRKAWPRGLFGNRNADGGEEGKEGGGGGGKDCAICLESFGANEEVMMTPCKHMFHHDCIVPWVKSRGQCPVCRLELCDRARRQIGRRAGAAAPRSIGIDGDGRGALLPDEELLHLVRAMEEAFNWINLSR